MSVNIHGVTATMDSVVKAGLLPDTIPTKCLCGHDLVINEKLTKVICSNPNCPYRDVNKFLKALNLLNIKADIGEVKALNIILTYTGVTNELLQHHIQLFDEKLYTNISYKSLGIHIEKLRLNLLSIKAEPLEFSKIVHLLQLPKIGRTYSELIFGQFSNLESMLQNLGIVENSQESYLKLSKHISQAIKIDITSPTVQELAHIIMSNLALINYASTVIFKTRDDKNLGVPCIYVAITGSVKYAKKDNGMGFGNRNELFPYLTEKYGVPVKQLGISKKNTQYLISDGDTQNSLKSKKAIRDGIMVVRSDEFVNIVKSISENAVKKNGTLNWNGVGES